MHKSPYPIPHQRHTRAIIIALMFSIAAISQLPAKSNAQQPEKLLPLAEEVELFNGKDLNGWMFFSDSDQTKTEDVWTVADGILKCTGKPAGYLQTKRWYRDYELEVQWRWPGERGGNSGVLVHTTTPLVFFGWPKSLEVQLQAGSAGDFWVICEGVDVRVEDEANRRAKPVAGNQHTHRRVRRLAGEFENEVGQWNTMKVICAGDDLKVFVNDNLVNHGTACTVTEGAIALQSEGTAIEFKSVSIKPIQKTDADNADTDKAVSSEKASDDFKDKLLSAKRVVFLGDSNTHSGEYINQIEATLLSHFDSVPEIINLGLPSETCCGLSEPIHPFPRPNVQERLARALEKTKPDLVFACYGMNDGIYHPFDESRFKAFQAGIQKLISAHQSADVPLVLLTPPPFDSLPMKKSGKLVPADAKEFSWKTIYENYDSNVIQKYAEWMLTLDEENCLVLDVHSPFKAYLAAKRASNPDFAFSKDGVHFDNAGHKVFAAKVLKGLGIQKAIPENDSLLQLIRQRRAISHPAWLTEVGHLRPGVKAGLPAAEVVEKTKALSQQIESALK